MKERDNEANKHRNEEQKEIKNRRKRWNEGERQ
jgi:hypothetical protein